MTCDDNQIAFDQHAAGATASISVADVEAHVATCEACTAYVALSRKVTMAMLTSVADAPFDRDAMRAKIDAIQTRAARWPFLGAVLSGGLLLANRLWGNWPGPLRQTVIMVAVTTLGTFALWTYFTRRYVRSLASLRTKSGQELVVGMRAELDRRMRREREGWWVIPILLVAYHAQFVGLAWTRWDWTLAMELLLLATIPIGIVRYRNAKRERALLG